MVTHPAAHSETRARPWTALLVRPYNYVMRVGIRIWNFLMNRSRTERGRGHENQAPPKHDDTSRPAAEGDSRSPEERAAHKSMYAVSDARSREYAAKLGFRKPD